MFEVNREALPRRERQLCVFYLVAFVLPPTRSGDLHCTGAYARGAQIFSFFFPEDAFGKFTLLDSSG